MTAEKQTLVLFSIQQLLPRLFNGIGSRWARITKVSQSIPGKSANVTVLMATSSVPEYFEQVTFWWLPKQACFAGQYRRPKTASRICCFCQLVMPKVCCLYQLFDVRSFLHRRHW